MRLVEQIRMALLSLFRRGESSARLDDEIRYHLERQIDENIAAGMLRIRRSNPQDGLSAQRLRQGYSTYHLAWA